MFLLWNDTDGVYASPDQFTTEAEAERFAAKFRARFAAQGYYLTADGLRISPADVELIAVPVEA